MKAVSPGIQCGQALTPKGCPASWCLLFSTSFHCIKKKPEKFPASFFNLVAQILFYCRRIQIVFNGIDNNTGCIFGIHFFQHLHAQAFYCAHA